MNTSPEPRAETAEEEGLKPLEFFNLMRSDVEGLWDSYYDLPSLERFVVFDRRKEQYRACRDFSIYIVRGDELQLVCDYKEQELEGWDWKQFGQNIRSRIGAIDEDGVTISVGLLVKKKK